MLRHRICSINVAAVCLVLTFASPVFGQEGLYHAIPFYSLLPHDFNDQGQLCGIISSKGAPAIWSVETGTIDLGHAVPGGKGAAVAINNLGHVAIYSDGKSYLWPGEGQAVPLGLFPTGQVTQAYDINDLDQIVGGATVEPRASYPGGTYVAFLWDLGSGLTFIGDLPGGKFDSGGRKINNKSVVAGESASSCGWADAFVWSKASGMKGLGAPPGYPCIVDVEDMNIEGWIVGNTVKWEGGGLPYIWSPATGFTVLNDLPGPNGCGEALAINDHGTVLGVAKLNCSDPPYIFYVFVWDETNGFRVLADLVEVDAATQSIGAITWLPWINNRVQLIGRRTEPPSYFYRFDPVLLGDMNCDGVVNKDDVQPFLGQMLKYAGTTPPLFDGEECGWWIGDINQDALLNQDDLAPFLALLP